MSHNFAAMLHEQLEKRVLLGGEFCLGTRPADDVGGLVDFDLPNTNNHRFAGGLGAAQDRTDSGGEFTTIERFCQVIVGAGVERFDFFFLTVAHRKYQDRNFSPFAKAADYFCTVDVGQTEIEHDAGRSLGRDFV
jgi:hypothetical protein